MQPNKRKPRAKERAHPKQNSKKPTQAPNPQQGPDGPIVPGNGNGDAIETKGLMLRILTWNVDGFKDPARRMTIESAL